MGRQSGLSPALRFAGALLLVGGGGLMLAGCKNQYGAPVPGQPLTWGQQHYLDYQRRQEENQNRMQIGAP